MCEKVQHAVFTRIILFRHQRITMEQITQAVDGLRTGFRALSCFSCTNGRKAGRAKSKRQ